MSQPRWNSTNQPEEYPVTFGEAVGIVVGAVVLVAVGLAGLGVKAIRNAHEPERAEAIARSLITYDIPGGSRGHFSANIGGGRIAVIISNDPPAGASPLLSQPDSFPRAIELLIGRIPVSQESTSLPPEGDAAVNHNFFSGFSFTYQIDGAFAIDHDRTEYQEFCGGITPVTLQQGTLTLPDQSTLPAVRYGINAERATDHYIAVITAVGQNALEEATDLFRSIRCTTTPPTYSPI